MPIVYVNDEPVEAEIGENLLDIARRNAAHFGFACGGLGICMSCVCRVREGGEHLSPPTNAEKRGISPVWISRGHRAACQVTLESDGKVDIISRPEELWRYVKAVLATTEDQNNTEQWMDLARFFAGMTVQQWLSFPMSSLNAVYQATKARPTPGLITGVLRDTGRVIRNMTGSGEIDINRGDEASEGEENAATPADGQTPAGSGAKPRREPKMRRVQPPIEHEQDKP